MPEDENPTHIQYLGIVAAAVNSEFQAIREALLRGPELAKHGSFSSSERTLGLVFVRGALRNRAEEQSLQLTQVAVVFPT